MPKPAADGSSTNPPLSIEQDYRIELARKAIHLCSLSIPIIYYFVSKSIALTLLVPVAAGFLLIDIARYYNPTVSRWFYSTFGRLLRTHEQDAKKKRLNGATYVLLSATICVLFFPKLITITAFTILIVSDSTAALVGKKFGNRPFFKKTRMGSLAFFISSLLVVAVTPKFEGSWGEYVIGIAGGVVGTFIEALSVDIDDNLSIPVAICMTMWVLYLIFYPSVVMEILASAL